jgi:hypothetical protein
MKIAKRLLLILSVCAAAGLFFAADLCQAQGPGVGIGPGVGHGMRVGRHRGGVINYGWNGRDSYYSLYALYRDGLIPIPPYFALHPPVYYSYPVPRPYGYSPFAYPGWVRTPDVPAPLQPATVVNPFLDKPPVGEPLLNEPLLDKPRATQPAPDQIEPEATSTAVVPKMIYNPYVLQPRRRNEPALARAENR